MGNIVKVGMADLKVKRNNGILTTLGLGSCVGITLYEPKQRIGGLVHIMLPSSLEIKNNHNKAKFADTGIEQLLSKMKCIGAHPDNIVAKIAGGSQMFKFNSKNDLLRIGERNIIASKKKLDELSIPIIGEDTGGSHGRTIELDIEHGTLSIRTIGHGTETI